MGPNAFDMNYLQVKIPHNGSLWTTIPSLLLDEEPREHEI